MNSQTPRALAHCRTMRRISLSFSVLLLAITGLAFLLCTERPASVYASASEPFSLSWSSSETHRTNSVAWGDYDGDGDLDLAVANDCYGDMNCHSVVLHRNDNGVLTPTPVWSSLDADRTFAVAWGDYDADGHLDLAATNFCFAVSNCYSARLYHNVDGTLEPSPAWSSVETGYTWSAAWGDVDGDGDLDLATGSGCNLGICFPNRLYRNVDGVLTTRADWTAAISESTSMVAWGDVDGDGDLDLAVGNDSRPNRLYRNTGGTLTTYPDWSSVEVSRTFSIAWGDYDGDGDLDLAAGNGPQPNLLYRNDNGALIPGAVWSSSEADWTYGIAWGDYDSDGDLDLFAGNTEQPSRLYRNDDGTLGASAAWSAPTRDNISGVAWGDSDGDGDLDVALANWMAPVRLYRNDGTTLIADAVYTMTQSSGTTSVAWGDADGDGDLDLAIGNWRDHSQLYRSDDGILTTTPVWTTTLADESNSVAWGDCDSDGDLDLAVGNNNQPNRIYRNDSGGLTVLPTWSAPITDATMRLAWGDSDGDGDLDLAVGNYRQPNRLYSNAGVIGGVPQMTLSWSSVEADDTISIAWGDVDNDGDLDLAVGNGSWDSGCNCPVGQVNRLYRNDGGMLTPSATWSSAEADYTTSVAWSDYDRDGDLDLAAGNWIQPVRLYRNDDGTLTTGAVWSSVESEPTHGVAWGDVDGDGDLDLIVAGAVGQPNRIRLYRNDGGTLTAVAVWSSANLGNYLDLAWGDVDGDGDLDFAAANGGSNHLYRNGRDGRSLPGSVPLVRVVRPGPNADLYSSPRIWSGVIPITYTLAHPQGNSVQSIRAWYSPNGGGQWLPAVATSNTVTSNLTAGSNALALDGIDDYVTTTNLIGLPSGNVSHTIEAWVKVTSLPAYRAWLLILGDPAIGAHHWLLNSNGIAQLGAWDAGGQAAQLHPVITPGAWTHVAVTFDGTLLEGYVNGQSIGSVAAAFDLQGVPLVLAQQHAGENYFAGVMDEVRVWNVARTQPQIQASMNQELTGSETGLVGYWRFNEGRGTTAFDRTPNHNNGTLVNEPAWTQVALPYVYHWDTFANGFFGQSDNVVFRIQAIPAIVTGRPNSVPGPYLYGAYASQTFPFRVRGTQVRVVSETITGTVPIPNAIVHRLPAGQSAGGAPVADNAGVPFRTDSQGYLQGRGEIGLGDRLLALAPVDWTRTITWADGLTDTMHLYYTNGRPTPTGIDAFTVIEPGVQVLTVSAEYPLVLFDLDVSLEWDAHHDPLYLDQLTSDFQKASRFLYDFSDGQAALGQVTVHQNGDDWLPAHVAIQASNRLQPYAVQGGIVFTPTVDAQHDDIVYDMGQVRMGATWNRYGDPGQGQGLDWQLALAHELSHFLLYQDDVYLGLDDAGLLIPVDTCTGSAMGDVYLPDNTEFVYDEGHWTAGCADTLANRTLDRTEWETIRLWYPWLITPTVPNSGPSLMPFDLTTVRILEPITPTDALEDPTFYVDYAGGVESSSQARALILRDEYGDVAGYDYVIDLGSPAAGEQNRVLARGARPGDRLCVFDPAQRQYGCEVVKLGDNRLALERDETWTPALRLSPVTSQTIHVEVGGLPPTFTLQARLYPEYEVGSEVITLTHGAGVYSGTFHLDYPPLAGHVQVWVEEATETNPRREIMAGYAIGGNPGGYRGGGPLSRSRGPLSRSRGPLSRSRGAPLGSPDGELIFFVENPLTFDEGELYAIQSAGNLPPLPSGKVAIGQGYSLVASPNVTREITGSISFQYLSMDVLAEGADEDQLAIHFWDTGQKRWRTLDTALDTYYNMASAPGRGSGVYALLAGVTIPHVTAVTPPAATNDVTTTLVISGGYFLEPVEVALVGPTSTYTLPLLSAGPYSITAVVTRGLPAREYQVVVAKRREAASPIPGIFALYDPPPAGACFYDYFESGAGRWQPGGEWAIAILPGGERAVSDSPAGNYANAIPPAITHTTYITSVPFSLVACPDPVLTFRHDYVMAHVGASMDLGRVEISADGGASWAELAGYNGGGIYPPGRGPEDVPSPEWTEVNWKEVRIDLSPYTGMVQLRFGLEVDRTASDKGWVIDDVVVRPASLVSFHAYLPLVLRAGP